MVRYKFFSSRRGLDSVKIQIEKKTLPWAVFPFFALCETWLKAPMGTPPPQWHILRVTLLLYKMTKTKVEIDRKKIVTKTIEMNIIWG